MAEEITIQDYQGPPAVGQAVMAYKAIKKTRVNGYHGIKAIREDSPYCP